MAKKNFNLEPPKAVMEKYEEDERKELKMSDAKGKYDAVALLLVAGGLIADLAIMALRRGRKF